MGIISLEKADSLYWLGRYTERVYTTLRIFSDIFDRMIEQPEGIYSSYCQRLNIPDIYTSNHQFAVSYLFGKDNPDSIVSNMSRAYDNAILLRKELTSSCLSYIQLALDLLSSAGATQAPLMELQQIQDYILAFWGAADDFVEQEECRNILKSGKYIERLDLIIRLDYNTKNLQKEYNKLINRLEKADLCYNKEYLERLGRLICEGTDLTSHRQEALCCLGGLIS